MGSGTSLECWDAGSIPAPAQWAKDLVLPQLRPRSQLWLRYDPWPGLGTPCAVEWQKRKKKQNFKFFFL